MVLDPFYGVSDYQFIYLIDFATDPAVYILFYTLEAIGRSCIAFGE